MTTESTVRWVATGGAVVTAGGLGLSLPLSIPPALVWTVLFVICGAIAVVMWRRHLDELLTEKHRQQTAPDRPYRPSSSTEDEPQY